MYGDEINVQQGRGETAKIKETASTDNARVSPKSWARRQPITRCRAKAGTDPADTRAAGRTLSQRHLRAKPSKRLGVAGGDNPFRAVYRCHRQQGHPGIVQEVSHTRGLCCVKTGRA